MLDSTEVLKPGSSAWETVTALPYKGVAHGAIHRGGFYLQLGKDILSLYPSYHHLTVSLPSTEILHYNLTIDAWSSVATMNANRNHPAMAVVEDVATFYRN